MFSLNVHQLGDFLLHAAIVLCAFAALAGLVGRHRRDGRLVLAAERAGYVVTGMVVTAALLLIHSFLTHDYENKYVANYSDNNMPWYYLLASFWGGQAGSLMFWETVLAIITGLVIWQNREQNRDMMPTVLALLAGLQIFFLGMMVIEANPFATFAINEPPVNGKGLEPLLQNPAMTFHPPSLLSGYVWFSVPFVFGIASLIHRHLDETWIRTTRRYAVISWGFLSMGNLFGGMWAYQELGWGGFWGWDPVENAALMPWISATAYLHSVMIQERRKLLKVWNVYLVLLTGYLTLFGTFLTRAGVIDSVHTFAQSDIGNYFVWMLAICLFATQALLAWRVADGSLAGGSDDEAWRTFFEAHPARRARAVNLSLIFVAALNVALFLWANGQATAEMRSAAWLIGFAFLGIFGMPLVAVVSASVVRNFVAGAEQPVPTARVEDMASREGVFLLNNYVLLSILCVVMFGTVGEKVSLFFWEPTKYSAPWYNGWLAPLGIALLLLMGIGPLVPVAEDVLLELPHQPPRATRAVHPGRGRHLAGGHLPPEGPRRRDLVPDRRGPHRSASSRVEAHRVLHAARFHGCDVHGDHAPARVLPGHPRSPEEHAGGLPDCVRAPRRQEPPAVRRLRHAPRFCGAFSRFHRHGPEDRDRHDLQR